MPTTFVPGLVSVTFRQLSPPEIVALVAQAGLDAVEWGGDVHAPHGDLARARDVRRATVDAGLVVAAYGSYYQVGRDENPCFDDVLATALELGAPTIRLWAGGRGSAEATDDDWAGVVADLNRVCALAAKHDVRIATEYHGGTLTDTLATTRRLLSLCPIDNFDTLWQPPTMDVAQPPSSDIDALIPRIGHVHAFHCARGVVAPLSDGAESWRGYLQALAKAGRPIALLIEFVRGAQPAAFLEDAATLRSWLQAVDGREYDRQT